MYFRLFSFFCLLWGCSIFQISYGLDNWLAEDKYLSSMEVNSDHATIIDLGGSLWCVWEAPSSEVPSETSLWSIKFLNGEWSEPTEWIKGDVIRPVLCRINLKEILLFYRSRKDNTKTYCQFTINAGKTWSLPQLLPAGIVGPRKGAPLVDKMTGTLLIPTSNISGTPEDSQKNTACWIEITDTRVKKWKNRYGPFNLEDNSFGPKDPSLIVTQEGYLKMFCRNGAHSCGIEKSFILYTVSKDKGRSWSQFSNFTFPNPDSAICTAQFMNNVFIIGNYSFSDKKKLACLISENYGDDWVLPVLLDSEYSENPSVAIESDYLHLVYTSQQNDHKTIRYKKIKLPELIYANSRGLEEEIKQILPVLY